MNQPSRLLFLLCFGALLSSCTTISQTVRIPQSTPDSIVTHIVADGVLHRQIVRKNGPWRIHCVEVDLTSPELDIISARAFDSTKGRETTSSIAKRHSRNDHTVIAAMNADFFNMETGENDLNQVIEGEIVKGVKKPLRAQFALGFSRTPYIEKFIFEGTAISANARFAIDAANSLKDSTVVVLNHFFGKYSRKEGESVLVLHTVRRNGDTVVTVVRDSLKPGEQFGIGDSVELLRTHDSRQTHLNQIAFGDTVRLVLRFLPRKERLKTLVGGLPRIVVDGTNIAATDSLKGLSPKFTETRHPRTGVGFSRDGSTVYLVTVDGRQQSSVGMSLLEFADLMIELGCYQALNLDGGGSTTMVIEGKVVNSPSDTGGERPVANALLVVKRK